MFAGLLFVIHAVSRRVSSMFCAPVGFPACMFAVCEVLDFVFTCWFLYRHLICSAGLLCLVGLLTWIFLDTNRMFVHFVFLKINYKNHQVKESAIGS